MYNFMLDTQYRDFDKFLIFLSNTKNRRENNSRKKDQLCGSKRCTMVSTGSIFLHSPGKLRISR